MTGALLVIGQSHVAAVRDAARLAREADPAAPRTRVIHTREDRYAPELVDTPAGPRLAPPLEREVRDQVARHAPRLASVIGGNAHTVVGLMRHERPFDFRLSGEPSPPPDVGSEMLLEAEVAAVLAHQLAPDLARLRALAALGLPFVQVESPPPPADAAWIAAAADAWFRDRGLAHRGMAGAGLRWRLWRLANRLVRAEAERLGAAWLPAPAAARDADGFLLAAFAGDATHGNARYGALLIEVLRA